MIVLRRKHSTSRRCRNMKSASFCCTAPILRCLIQSVLNFLGSGSAPIFTWVVIRYWATVKIKLSLCLKKYHVMKTYHVHRAMKTYPVL